LPGGLPTWIAERQSRHAAVAFVSAPRYPAAGLELAHQPADRASLQFEVTPEFLLREGGVTGERRVVTRRGASSNDTLLRVSFYERRVLPRVVDVALGGRAFSAVRARVASDLGGEVLEVGFGSGRNVPHYPPTVSRIRAVDPAVAARKLAAERVAASGIPVEYVGLDGEHLPLDDDSVDHVLTTWTLCTIPDVEQALAEIRRVLRPGGTLHFVEHGRAPDPKVARWQDRLTPMQRRVAGGCHLNRPIDALITGSGLDMARLDNYFMRGPKAFGYMFEGVATKA